MKGKFVLSMLLSILTCPLFFLQGCSIFQTPAIISVSPGNGSQVSTTAFSITVVFSKPMNRDSVQQAFSLNNLSSPGSQVGGDFSWNDNNTLVFNPNQDQLSYPDQYTIQISGSALDKDGNSLAKTFYSSFNLMTGSGYPSVISTIPANGASNVNVQSSISVQFSQPMDPGSTISAFSTSPSLPGNMQISSNVLVFKPSAPLSNGCYYTINISQSAESTNLIKMAKPYSFYFLAGVDLTIPYVTGVYTNYPGPALVNNVNNIEKTVSSIILAFNIPMNMDSVYNSLNINPSASYSITWISPSNASINFLNTLIPSTNYSITLNTGAMSSSGRYLESQYQFQFFTGGPFSLVPNIYDIEAEEWNGAANINIPIQTNTINSISINSADTFNIDVSFNACTNISLLSLYTNSSITFLYGNGSLASIGNIFSINQTASFNKFSYTITSVCLSNYYKLTLKGGVNGIQDSCNNPLPADACIYFTITSTN